MARRLDRRYAHLTAVYNRKISNRSLSGTERSQLDIWSCRFRDRCSSLCLLLIVDIFSRRRVHAGVRDPIRIRSRSCEKRRAYREQKKRNATTGKAHWRPYQPRRLPRKRHRLKQQNPWVSLCSMRWARKANVRCRGGGSRRCVVVHFVPEAV